MDDVVNRSEPAAQCNCTKSGNASNRAVKWTTIGGVFAALGVCAACCLLPFTLLSVGVAGAWVSALDSLAPYKWVFISVTGALLAYGFYVAYWRPGRNCPAGASCTACGTSRSVRAGLWIATILAVGGLVFEQIEPYLES
jgi:mercuric ion transport protein